jgi:hypothetical protein
MSVNKNVTVPEGRSAIVFLYYEYNPIPGRGTGIQNENPVTNLHPCASTQQSISLWKRGMGRNPEFKGHVRRISVRIFIRKFDRNSTTKEADDVVGE